MKEWLTRFFGSTLCDLFFFPFHELYTAGLYDRIAPQNAFKSPVELSLVKKGASREISRVGYNASFFYPDNGLNTLVRRISSNCDIMYGKRVIKIEPSCRKISFEDSSSIIFDTLISTLPLNKVIEMTELKLEAKNDPYTSVLVLNLGAKRGGKCPDDHWLYTPDSKSGFHRVGFYSNVESSFLPASSRINSDRVGIYVERAYPGGEKPSDDEISGYMDEALKELQVWDFIGEVEVADFNWIDVAYTWSWPDSTWRQEALETLREYNIHQIGRYGRWSFQGIADSIRDGLSIIDSL
jgi:protoporphyrinogen oxidase